MESYIAELFSNMLNRISHLGLTIFLVLIAIISILYTSFGYLRAVALGFKLPGPPARFFLGNALSLMDTNILEKYKTVNCERVIRVWGLTIPHFFITHPEDLQIVLSSRKHTQKVYFYDLLHNFLGNGLITSSVEEWSVHRRLIQPRFHINILEKFLNSFIDASNVFVQRLRDSPSQLSITHLVNECIFDILHESILGIPILTNNGINLESSPFRQGTLVAAFRLANPWLLLDWIYKLTEIASSEMNQKRKLDAFTRMMIDKRRNAKKNGGTSKVKCLLDYMLEISENNPNFTDDDIVKEACTFMLAGQDSVGAATAFCLFLLAQHPDCQQKCVDELNEIFMDDVRRMPTMMDIRKMRYLEQCIKETLRLYPSVPLIGRKISEDIQCGKYTIPSGSNILITPYLTHRMASIYPKPEYFDPDRFSPEQCEQRHPYAFIPFSAGPRNCMGYKFAYIEMKTIISTILREFELLPVDGKTKIKTIFRFTIRASGGLHIKLKPRE